MNLFGASSPTAEESLGEGKGRGGGVTREARGGDWGGDVTPKTRSILRMRMTEFVPSSEEQKQNMAEGGLLKGLLSSIRRSSSSLLLPPISSIAITKSICATDRQNELLLKAFRLTLSSTEFAIFTAMECQKGGGPCCKLSGVLSPLKRPDLKGTFRCSHCLKQFCHSSSLSRHRMQMHFRRFRCTQCQVKFGNTDALRAHMSSEHSLGRVFLCRCCNWAFRDKNSLHEHLKERRTKEQKAAERSEGNGVSLKAEQKRPSDTLPSAADIVPMPVGDVPPAIGISLAQLPLSSEQNTLMADIWSNILLSQTQLRNNLANGGRAPTEREQQNVPKTDGGGQNTSSDHQFAAHFASSFASASQSLPLPPPLSSSSSSFSASSFVPSLPNGGGTTVIVQNGVSSSSSSFSSSSSSFSSSMPSNCLIHSSSLPLGSSSFDSDSELSSHSQTISPTHSDVGGRRAVVVPSLQQKRSNAATGEGAANRQQNATEQPQQSAKCAQCLVAKPRLVLAQAKCSYLEATTVTFQNELLRLNAKCLLAEQCIRRLEMELRQWRERNDFLRFRLLECREKTLEIIAGGGSAGAELSKFVGDVLKITLV
ncbi:hypothetical protein niasHT_003914 [Heterodera trifolii]|uniref:C2H2-type domain-containing protein n=1 Tax=Heterodera trifolii TaxID=157864 RepID=A0ABD2LV88_9BILA